MSNPSSVEFWRKSRRRSRNSNPSRLFPHFLPDGKTLLFTVYRTGDSTAVEQAAQRYTDGEDQGFVQLFTKRHSIAAAAIGVYTESTGPRLLDLPGDFTARPVYTPTGHLLFRNMMPSLAKNLWAAPFDPVTLTVTGDQFLVAANSNGHSASTDGTLVSRSATDPVPQQLMWVTRGGVVETPIGQPMALDGPALSPDGRRVAGYGFEEGNADVWIHDVQRGGATRFTFDPAAEDTPAWSPAGDRIVFRSNRNDNFDLFVKAADGSGAPRPLVAGPLDESHPDWSRDGRYLVYHQTNDNGNRDVWYLPMTGSEDARQPQPLLQTSFNESMPQLSPDGRYLAYQSNERGRFEIFVTPFPGGEGKWQVSVNGGTQPRWNGRGDELFFVADQTLMAVPVETRPAFSTGIPQPLFSAEKIDVTLANDYFFYYDAAPDGRRFVMMQNAEQEEEKTPTITVVESWIREFRP